MNKTKKAKKDVRGVIHIHPDEYKQMAEIRQERGISISFQVRKAIQNYLESFKK